MIGQGVSMKGVRSGRGAVKVRVGRRGLCGAVRVESIGFRWPGKGSGLGVWVWEFR